jgi:NADPH:quinone reductase-like Zn-dependent oxidoreductase
MIGKWATESNFPLGSPDYGVCGESAILPAYTLMPAPPHLSVEEATSMWMQYMTAWGGLIAFEFSRPAGSKEDKPLRSAKQGKVRQKLQPGGNRDANEEYQ